MPQGGESHKTIMTTVQTDITPVPLQMSKSNGRLSKGEGGEERDDDQDRQIQGYRLQEMKDVR